MAMAVSAMGAALFCVSSIPFGAITVPDPSAIMSPLKRRVDGDSQSGTPSKLAKVSENVASASVASQSVESEGGPVALGDCVKCFRPVHSGTEGSLGNSRCKQQVHKACVLAYKRRSKMNKKNKQLGMAWEGYSPEEKAQWFIKNTVECLNDEAQDAVQHTVAVHDISAQDTTVRNAAVPFHIFEERSEMRGWSADKIKTEWNRMLLDPNVRKVKFNNEVMVCRLEGVYFDDRQSSQTSAGTSTTKTVASEEELREAREHGAKAIAASRQAGVSFMSATMSFAMEHVSIPDELIQNLGAFENLGPQNKGIVESVFEKALMAQERKQRMLDDLLREDLVEASIFLASIGGGSSGHKGETEGDVQKFKVAKGNEFQKAKELFELASQSLITEAVEVVKAVEAKLGKDCDSVTESLEVLAEADKALLKTSKDYGSDADKLKIEFQKAKTIDEMREKVAALKLQKSERIKEQSGIRKAISCLKALGVSLLSSAIAGRKWLQAGQLHVCRSTCGDLAHCFRAFM